MVSRMVETERETLLYLAADTRSRGREHGARGMPGYSPTSTRHTTLQQQHVRGRVRDQRGPGQGHAQHMRPHTF